MQSAHGHMGGSRPCREAGAELLEVYIPFGSRDTMVGGSGAAAAPRRRDNQAELDAAIVRRLHAMHGAFINVVPSTDNEFQHISHQASANNLNNTISICEVLYVRK